MNDLESIMAKRLGEEFGFKCHIADSLENIYLFAEEQELHGYVVVGFTYREKRCYEIIWEEKSNHGNNKYL